MYIIVINVRIQFFKTQLILFKLKLSKLGLKRRFVKTSNINMREIQGDMREIRNDRWISPLHRVVGEITRSIKNS